MRYNLSLLLVKSGTGRSLAVGGGADGWFSTEEQYCCFWREGTMGKVQNLIEPVFSPRIN